MKENSFATYPEAVEYLAALLKPRMRAFDPSENYIVLTPDRYTQSLERALFCGGGALNCEVLTISRLARRIAQGVRTLSREGGVMLVAEAVATVEKELTYYARAAAYPEFARDVYNTLLQAGASDEDLNALCAKAKGTTADKLRDLARIKREYDRLKGESADAPDRIAALISAVPDSALIKSSHIYAVGYKLGGDDTTRLNRRLFEVISRHAASFEYVTACAPEPRKTMAVMSVPDRISQYKEVAARIREAVDAGENAPTYGDVSVVCPEPRAIKRIFAEYKIPSYADESTPLYNTPPLAAVECVYKLATEPDSDTLVSLCKNPFSGCSSEGAALLQNRFAPRGNVYGVLDKLKDEQLVGEEKAAAERACALVDAFRSAQSAGFPAAVRAVIDKGGFVEINAELFKDMTDAVTPVVELAQISERYGSHDFDRAARGFFAAAQAVEIKTVPRKRDRVLITKPNALRLAACKLLFVTDFNEGVLPATTGDCGLISDREINDINGAGGKLEPTALQRNRAERNELKAAISNAESVFCTYTTAGGGKRSAFISEVAETEIKLDFDALRVKLFNAGTDGSDDLSVAELYACTESAARELAARGLLYYARSVEKAVGRGEHNAAPFTNRIENGIALERISPSELSCWFACPYKRFLSYSVGLKERRTGGMSAPDFGTVVHTFMEEFIKRKPYDCSRAAVEKIIDYALEKDGISADAAARERLITDAVDFAELNVKIIEAGRYEPCEAEYEIEVPLEYTPAFDGKTHGGARAEITFKAKIDRVDKCASHVRIIDYKTGKKKFELKKCLNGCDMQLPLYAAAYNALNVDERVTGIFYVVMPSRYGEDGKPMRGRMIKDGETLEDNDAEVVARAGASDDYVSSELFSARVKLKNGEAALHGNSAALMDERDFDGLTERCVNNARVAVGEITGGYIERTPEGKACEFCPYGGICGNKKVLRGAADDDDE